MLKRNLVDGGPFFDEMLVLTCYLLATCVVMGGGERHLQAPISRLQFLCNLFLNELTDEASTIS